MPIRSPNDLLTRAEAEQALNVAQHVVDEFFDHCDRLGLRVTDDVAAEVLLAMVRHRRLRPPGPFDALDRAQRIGTLGAPDRSVRAELRHLDPDLRLLRRIQTDLNHRANPQSVVPTEDPPTTQEPVASPYPLL